jgi:hypothetical protein
MPVIDTILGKAVNPSATFTGVTFATGDSGQIRNFPATSQAYIDRITRVGAASGSVRLLSPYLHDNVRGITFTSPQSPATRLMPRWNTEFLQPQDTLTIQLTGGAAETDLASVSVYYSQLAAGTARLHSIGDIMGNIAHIKPMVVAITNSATTGTWTDTLINTTEALLKANTDYAVLGFVTDTAMGMVGIKGLETLNLRIAGPAVTDTNITEDFFINWSNDRQSPHIPVFNSANIGSTYVSTCDATASTTANVQLILAQMTNNLAT